MQVIDPGHCYLLESFDGGTPVELTFVKRSGERYPGNVGSHPGTNCQEVLRALVERSEYLFNQIPSAETECIIGSLRTALLLFELRAARNHGRFLDLPTTKGVMSGATCPTCGHVECRELHGE